MTHKFLKIAGVKTEEEFYKKFPDEQSFFKAFPKAAKGMAITPEEKYQGLNNPNFNSMEFPMEGDNIFRGLDNGQPVLLVDSTGKQKVLTGPQDVAMMKGTVKEKKIKAQKGTSLDATTADSLAVYNNAKQINDYYNKTGNYMKGYYDNNNKLKENIPTIVKNNNDVTSTNDFTYNSFFDPARASGKMTGKALVPVKDADRPQQILPVPKSQYRKDINSNQYYQREIADGILDTRSPMTLFDKRIKPQLRQTYSNINKSDSMLGDVIDLYEYDPIAVKPYNMLTPSEKIIRDKKYPKTQPTGINSPNKKGQQLVTKFEERKDYPIVTRPKAQVRGTITPGSQEQIPEPQGQSVFGPSNGLIGYQTKQGFQPTLRRDHLSKVNQADIDLLNNPEALNKYVSATPRYKKGGTIKAQQGASVDWNSEWIKSPMAKKMNQGEQDFTGERLQALEQLPPVNRLSTKELSKLSGNKSKHLGVYDYNNHTVNVNSGIKDADLLDTVTTHEKSHASDRGGKLMSVEDKALTDSEGRALLNQARYEYQKAGVFDPFTQPFKSEYLKNNNSGIRNLKKNYSDEQITNMMNSVSSIDTKGNPIAKCGKSVKGKMKKAQQGVLLEEDPKKKFKVFQQNNTMAVDNTVTTPYLPIQNNPAQFKELAAPIQGFNYTDNTLNWTNPGNINGNNSQPPLKPSGYENTPIDISKQTGYDKNKRMIMPTSPDQNRIDNNASKNISSRSMGSGDNNAKLPNGKPGYGGQGKVNLGDVTNLGIGMAQLLMGPEGPRRRIDNTLAYNPYPQGTGSQAIAAKGKSIRPSNQGSGLTTYEGGNAPKMSENMFDGGTHLFTGDSHADGGITSSFNGTTFEAEGGEPFAKIDNKGVVFGNMENPLTGRTYKKDAKDIMKKEMKVQKYLDKGTELVNTKDPSDKFQVLAFNSGTAMMKGAAAKQKQLADSKKHLADLQEAHLEIVGEDAIAKKGKSIKAQQGTSIPQQMGPYENPLELMARDIAATKGINPEIFHRIITQESQYNPSAVSVKNPRTGKNASGIAMLSPEVAKKYGISRKQLTSNDYGDITKVLDAGASEYSSLLQKYGGDDKLALAAYNGGTGAIDYAKKKLGKDNITGDEWLQFQENDLKSRPTNDKSVWRTQTREYVNNIAGTDNSTFPSQASKFNKNFYQQPTPDFSLQLPKLKGLTPEEMNAMDANRPISPAKGATGNGPYDFKKITPLGITPTNDKLKLSQIMGEIPALFDTPDFVEGGHYNPDLYTPYQVSFQDRINQNSKTFNALAPSLVNNVEAQSTLAGQLYSANDSVKADEFRANQAISSDITSKNVTLLNEAKLKNISLTDQKYVRQAQAKSTTKENRQNALNSISSKILQKEASNNMLNVYKNLYPHYDFDKNFQVNYQGPDAASLINFPTEVGQNPSNPDGTTTVNYDANGVKQKKDMKKKKMIRLLKKEVTEPSYKREKGFMDLEKLKKDLNNMKFNGSIVKKYKQF